MADPVDVISTLENLTGTSLRGARQDTSAAALVMGLLQADNSRGQILERTAELALNRWREQFGADSVADKVLEQLQVANGGAPLSNNITNSIRSLLESPDAETFASSLSTLREQHETYLNARRAATTDAERQAVPISTIALLINASESMITFARDNQDASPAAQVDAHERSAFSRIFDFNRLGNDGGSNYAMLAGLPRDQWGEYNEATGGYSGFQDETYAISAEFPNAEAWGQTPIPVFSGPQNPDEARAFWSDPDRVQAFITVHLERRGIVEFDKDENGVLTAEGREAQAVWNQAMGEAFTGDEPVANGNELMERMQEIALEHDSITLMSERDINAASFQPSDTTMYFYRTVQMQGLVSFAGQGEDNAERHAFIQAAEEVLAQASDQGLDYYQIMGELQERLGDVDGIEFDDENIKQMALNMGYTQDADGNLVPPPEEAPEQDASLGVADDGVQFAAAEVSPHNPDGTPIVTPTAYAIENGSFTATAGDGVRMDADPSQTVQMAAVAEVGIGLRSQPELGVDPAMQPRDPSTEMRVG